MTELDKRSTTKKARELIAARVAKVGAIADAQAAEKTEQDKIARVIRAAQDRADRAARKAQERADETKRKVQERADQAKAAAQRIAEQAKRDALKSGGSAKRNTERAIADALRAGWTPAELRKLGVNVPRAAAVDEPAGADLERAPHLTTPGPVDSPPTEVSPARRATGPSDAASERASADAESLLGADREVVA